MKRLILAAALAVVASAVRAETALEFAVAGMGRSVEGHTQTQRGKRNKVAGFDKRFARRSMLAGVHGPLADKAREIEAACGSRVISGVRHTRVRGSGRWSLHSSGHAVDMQGNPGCIYARLRGWSGGYSTDYGRVRHVHISLGGREDGIRFAHRGGRTRIAWR